MENTAIEDTPSSDNNSFKPKYAVKKQTNCAMIVNIIESRIHHAIF